MSIAIIAGLFLLFIATFALRGTIKRAINNCFVNREADRAGKCVCGYPLRGLDLARCPECGRVTHFEATAEELGLTNEELARVQQKRREREVKP